MGYPSDLREKDWAPSRTIDMVHRSLKLSHHSQNHPQNASKFIDPMLPFFG
jgi:hypothetical protein